MNGITLGALAWLRDVIGSASTTRKHDNLSASHKNAQRHHENKHLNKHEYGHVTLIGAGPGDAELLTLKAYRAIQSAEVILFDALVSEDIIAMFPASAEQVYVGKRYAAHSMKQTEICDLILRYAATGKRIVRLKGGDPAIFARAGEECEVLSAANVPFSIIPGITAASGASAYAGIPLTHRACAQSVRFVTAHLKSEAQEPDWSSMIGSADKKHGETLVFYMGLRRLDLIAERLIEHGMKENMPVAVIENATHAEQKVCVGTLGDIASVVKTAGVTGPAITIVGDVVSYRNHVTPHTPQQAIQTPPTTEPYGFL